MSAAASCMSGSTCEYTSMVMTVLECAPDVQLRPSGAPRRRAAVLHKYQLTRDGLYIAHHVLGDGWLQIGDKRAGWRFTPREGLR